MKPRICMVVHKDYLLDGRVRRYAESLADADVEVDILCVQSEQKESPAYRKDIRIHRIPLGHSSQSRGGYLIEYIKALFLFTIWLLGLYIKRRYHIIHTHNMPDFLIFCGILPRLLGAKLILDVHDPMPEFYMSKFAQPQEGLPVTLLRWQEHISARIANRVIAANQNFKQNLIVRGVSASKITVVNNIADTNIFDRDLYSEQSARQTDSTIARPFTLLYPGTLAPRYCLELPIRAAVKLRHAIPNLCVQIVGPHNEYAHELTQLAQELNVQGSVEILPAVPIHEVPRFMMEADIGIYTARSDPHMSIATPTKVLEYVQMGLPTVASRLPVLEQLFDDRSIQFFEAGNVDAFVAAILKLWKEPERQAALVTHANQDFLRRYSWQQEQMKYFVLLNHMLEKRVSVTSTPTTLEQPLVQETIHS